MMLIELYRSKKAITPAVLSESSDVEVKELELLVQGELADISTQIKQSQAEYHETGKSDNKWYSNALGAKNFRIRISKSLEAELARRRDLRKKQHNATHEVALMRAMDTLLSPEVKKQILELARDFRIQAENG